MEPPTPLRSTSRHRHSTDDIASVTAERGASAPYKREASGPGTDHAQPFLHPTLRHPQVPFIRPPPNPSACVHRSRGPSPGGLFSSGPSDKRELRLTTGQTMVLNAVLEVNFPERTRLWNKDTGEGRIRPTIGCRTQGSVAVVVRRSEYSAANPWQRTWARPEEYLTHRDRKQVRKAEKRGDQALWALAEGVSSKHERRRRKEHLVACTRDHDSSSGTGFSCVPFEYRSRNS